MRISAQPLPGRTRSGEARILAPEHGRARPAQPRRRPGNAPRRPRVRLSAAHTRSLPRTPADQPERRPASHDHSRTDARRKRTTATPRPVRRARDHPPARPDARRVCFTSHSEHTGLAGRPARPPRGLAGHPDRHGHPLGVSLDPKRPPATPGGSRETPNRPPTSLRGSN